MTRQRHERAWPFLCILACLAVLAVTWPRDWEQVAPFRSTAGPDCGGAHPSGEAAPVGHELAPTGQETLRLTVADAAPARAAATESAVEWTPGLEKAMERVTELQMAEPAKRQAGRPIDVEWPELRVTDPVVPTRRPMLYSEVVAPAPGQSPTAPEPRSAQQPAVPRPVHRLPSVDASSPVEGFAATDILPALDEIVAQSPPDQPESPWKSAWPEPVALLERLGDLAWECETGPWARAVARQVRRLGSIPSAGSDEEALSILRRLKELNRAAGALAEQLEGSPPAIELRRTQYALARRLALWSRVITAGGPSSQVSDRAEADTRQLRLCLARINQIAGDPVVARAWRDYLELEPLERLLREPATGRAEERHTLARRTLEQLTRPGMTPEQRQFLDREPFAELESHLRRWAAGPIDLGGLLRHVEQYEQTGSPSDARLIAADCRLLGLSPQSDEQELGRQLQTHYRNANVRIVLTRELLDRMMPDREPEYQRVDDQVLGRPVHGRSVTSTEVGIRLIPDPSRLRLALVIKGLVASLTESTSGPATFWNGSESTYIAMKEIELGTWGLRLQPAKVAVDSDVELRSLRTNLDMIPVVGAVVQEIAQSQHEKSQPEMSRDVEEKVAARAKQQIDEEAGARLGDLNERLKARVLEPLADLSLGPTMLDAQTTEHRLTMRLRLAAEEQLGSHTPRPRALSDSLASCQVHESALNNLIERMGLDGGTLTLADVRRRIATIFNRPEMLEEDPGRDDVKITFAEKDAVAVRFRDGRVEVTLSIARLSKSPSQWDDFRVRAYYRPQISGQSGELVRDGLVEVCAEQSLDSQIALRTIFSKTFSRHHPWKLTPEVLVADPRMADLAVTQLVIDDGWIGWALGPKRPGLEPVVAQRSPGSVD